MEAFILENLNYSPSYQNNLSNHLSMSILALFHLGANESQLSEFNSFYISKLEKINQFDEINVLKQQYLQRINDNQEEIEAIINELIPYITSAGFHAIIRTSYILSELKQQFLPSNTITQELALSLAY